MPFYAQFKHRNDQIKRLVYMIQSTYSNIKDNSHITCGTRSQTPMTMQPRKLSRLIYNTLI